MAETKAVKTFFGRQWVLFFCGGVFHLGLVVMFNAVEEVLMGFLRGDNWRKQNRAAK